MLLLFFLPFNVHGFMFYPLPFEDFIIVPICALLLSIMAGLMSGLTVGLMGIDKLSLKSQLSSGTEEGKLVAKRILNLLDDHHLLLVTLLLANALSLESLPVVLEIWLGRVKAYVVSVIMTLFISEVVPLALCTSRFQVPIASASANLVRFLILIFWPIGYPLARLLDKFVGKSGGKTLNGEELKTLFLIHSVGDNRVCTNAQVSLIHKAIDLKDNILWEIFTPIHRIVAIQEDVRVDDDVLALVQDSGFTCLPVKNVKGAFVGVLNVGDLIFAECGGMVKDYCSKSVVWCSEYMSPYSVLLNLKAKRKRIAFIIQEGTGIVVGLITQNDIFRYLINSKKIIYRREILDTNHNDESIEILSGKFSKRQTFSFEMDELDSPIQNNSDVLNYLNIE